MVSGRILDADGGRFLTGVRVRAQGDSGVAVPVSRQVLTAYEGTFEIELPATDDGVGYVTVSVNRDGRPGYAVPAIAVRATTTTGDAKVLPPWIDARPRFFVVLVLRALDGSPIANVPVEFARTSGAQLRTDAGPVAIVTGTTAESGWSFLMEGLWTDRVEPVFGTLTIRPPAPQPPIVIPGVSFTPSAQYAPGPGFVVLEIP